MKNYVFCLLLVVISTSILAQENKPEADKEKTPDPEAFISETTQSVTINGKTFNLATRAGTMELRDDNNKPIALFGFTSYTLKDGDATRPILFAYNGGPGSSSIWLHMGALGPERIVVNDGGYTPPAPYQLVNNEYSILDVADLVMIDPVGTGLSVPLGDKEFKDFWGVDQDIRSIGQFITQYLIENGRMNSPKFLLGESYGTFRNAGVMKYLQDNGIALNGVIMVSTVLDLRTLMFPPNEDLPYVLHLPTFAATAWYHNKVEHESGDLEEFLKEVRAFAENEYSQALFRGDRLSKEETGQLAVKLEKYTGIDKKIWENANLRLQRSEFLQELLRDEGYTLDRLDSRIKGYSYDMLSQFPDYEPLFPAVGPSYTAGFYEYFYNTLKVDRKLAYTIFASRRKGFKWDWSHRGNSAWGAQIAISTAPDMAETLTQNPNTKVLILNGYFDNGTVFYGVEHTIDHLELNPEVKKNIVMKYYEAGHMMYLHTPSLEKFKKDISEFIVSLST